MWMIFSEKTFASHSNHIFKFPVNEFGRQGATRLKDIEYGLSQPFIDPTFPNKSDDSQLPQKKNVYKFRL